MIEPILKDQAFLDDVAAANLMNDGFRLWWLGQSGFLIQFRGRHLLLDPYLSDSLTEKYAHTDLPHIRMTARVVDPARLDFIDVVTSSHVHTDHLDPATLRPLLRANPELAVVVPESILDTAAQRLGVPPDRLLPMDEWRTLTVNGFRLTAVASAHEQVERDALGRCLYLGYVVEFGPWAIYHCGDTVLYDGLAEKLTRFRMDVALLPINGRAPQRRVAGNLNGREAAWLAHAIGARTVIPCHYEMFTFNTASPDEFVAACHELGQCANVLRCGQRAVLEVHLPSLLKGHPSVRRRFQRLPQT